MAFSPKISGKDLRTKLVVMLRLFVVSVIISAMKDAKSVFAAIANGSTRPDGDTVHAVLQHLAPALQLGAISGALTGFTVVAIWSLGNPLWAILSPFLANTTALIGNILGSMRAARKKKEDGGSNTS